MPEIGKMLVVFGAVMVLIGLALWSGFGAGWLGAPAGRHSDRAAEFGFYFPIVTCIHHQHCAQSSLLAFSSLGE